MSANIESMFYVREVPWHGLGTRVEEAISSRQALEKAGLKWKVRQRWITTDDGVTISGYMANVRESDGKILGVVSDRYKIVQNEDAFAFTDSLLGKGLKYETAGSLSKGRRVWILAKLQESYFMHGEKIEPYLVFSNTHDGTGSVKVALTPIRVVCNNTLCLALNTAERSWSAKHTTNIGCRLNDAKETLFRAEGYMDALGKEVEKMNSIYLPKEQVEKEIERLVKIPDDATPIQERNAVNKRQDIMFRYLNAPDLKHLPENGYRFYNAVSDFATHAKPQRETKNYQENLFAKQIDTDALTAQAYKAILQAA